METSKTIISLITKEMKAQGITAAELVRRTGYTRRTIDYWLHGARGISLEAADRVLSVLGVPFTIGEKEMR